MSKKINKKSKTKKNTKNNSINSKYNSLYNKLKNSLYKYKPINKNIKLKITKLEEDNNDIFFPYKCYIDLYYNINNHVRFEIFLSDIICNYTMKQYENIENKEIFSEFILKENKFNLIKGYNNVNLLLSEIINNLIV
jgi:hypothetical protein